MLKKPQRDAQDFAGEIQVHIELEAARLRGEGLSAQDALDGARRSFGNVTTAQERFYESSHLIWLHHLGQDLRYAARLLRKSPGFTLVAVLTLALGIGATTAIFSVVYAVLLNPLPYPDSSSLVFVSEAKPQKGIKTTGVSYLDMQAWREQNTVFTEMAGTQAHDLSLTGRGDPTTVHTVVVTPELFSMLEEKPLLGRTFFAADNRKGAPPVVILSEQPWRERFASDPQVVGTTATLDQRAFTIVGVMPAGFHFPPPSQKGGIWIPIVQDPVFGTFIPSHGGHYLSVVARLKPGISLAQAQADMNGINANIARQFPDINGGWQIHLQPLEQVTVGSVRKALWILLGAVLLVLLIACANIANLLLSRATSRGKEIAVRIALGAGRPRIIFQLLTESAALGLCGGIAGVLLAYWGVKALVPLVPSDLPQADAIHVNGVVLLFALVLGLAASVLFGLAPALFAADTNLQASFREETGRGSSGGKRGRVRNLLAVAEIALAMILLVGAGLLVRSFLLLTSVSPGFDVTHVVKAEVSLPQFQYSKPQQWTVFANDLLTRVQAQPGMQETAIGLPLPIVHPFVNLGFTLPDGPPLPPGMPDTADYASVSPNYFQVMGIPLLRGRVFNEHDSASAPPVLLISETMAQIYFANRDPLGQHVKFFFLANDGVSYQIVGIVADVRDVSLSQAPGPMMYAPFAQLPLWGAVLVSRTSLSPGAVATVVRQQAAKIDRNLPVTDVGPLPSFIDATVAQPRFRTLLLGLFSGLALLLAAAGIFGVVSYSVACQTREIGIRMALGAQPRDVLRRLAGGVGKMALAGIALGIAASLGTSRLISTLLFGVRATDPLTFGVVVAVLISVVAIAAYLPARRAMRVDPVIALRHE